MQRPTTPQWRRTATPLFLAFISLLAATILWVVVTDAENPNRIDDFAGGIEVTAVNVPEGVAVASIGAPIVRLRVSTDDDTFNRLTAADFRAEVDLEGVTETNADVQQVVISRVVGPRNVEIVSTSPSVVTVKLQPETTKTVPVRVNRIGTPPQGYSVSVIQPSPSSARVTGAQSLVQLVDSVEADVNLTGLRITLQQQFPLVPRDSRGANIRGVNVEPDIADVRVNLVQQDVTLSLLVAPQIQGGVADGYNVTSIVTDPPAVTVTGPLQVLQALTFVSTEPIDVSGQRADLTRSVRLVLPAGVQATRETVRVNLKIAPAKGDLIVGVAPEITGVGEGLIAIIQTASVSVRLRGDLPVLRTLGVSAVRAVVNVSGLAEGVYVLPPSITAPGGIEIVSSDPATVVVVLRK